MAKRYKGQNGKLMQCLPFPQFSAPDHCRIPPLRHHSLPTGLPLYRFAISAYLPGYRFAIWPYCRAPHSTLAYLPVCHFYHVSVPAGLPIYNFTA